MNRGDRSIGKWPQRLECAVESRVKVLQTHTGAEPFRVATLAAMAANASWNRPWPCPRWAVVTLNGHLVPCLPARHRDKAPRRTASSSLGWWTGGSRSCVTTASLCAPPSKEAQKQADEAKKVAKAAKRKKELERAKNAPKPAWYKDLKNPRAA